MTRAVGITIKMTMTVEDGYPMPDPGTEYGVAWSVAYDNMRDLAEHVAKWGPEDCWVLEGKPRRSAIGGGYRVGGEVTAVDVEAPGYAGWDIDFDEPVLGVSIVVTRVDDK